MRYPVEELRPSSGYISAKVFENKVAGVAEALYWNIEIEFEAVEFDGSCEQPSLQVDTFAMPIRDWRDLANQVVEGAHNTIQTSFYVFGHDLASWTKVCFGTRIGFTFDVELEINLELLGLDSGWDDKRPSAQSATIRVQTVLPYTGFYIDEQILEVRPETTYAAILIAARHADLSCYKPVVIEGSRLVFHAMDV